MRLIKISEDGMPIYSDEAKMIKQFYALLERDKSKNKKTATKELAFVHLWCIHDSRYSMYEKGEKVERLKDDLNLQDWEPDQLIVDAINKYTELIETRSTFLIKKANSALKQVEDFFKDLDINSSYNKTKSGSLVVKPKDVTDFYKDLPNLVKAEQEANKLVRNEYNEAQDKIKKDMGFYEGRKFELDKDRPVA